MKRFTETFNPGNQLLKTGVTNHYTPIQNILTNIKNLFCLTLGIVAEVGEDGVSIKLSSSQFISQEKVNELLYRPLYNDVFTHGTSSIQGYIIAQGLPKVTTINIGGYYIVYFSPDDIRQAEDPFNMAVKCQCPCPCETCESIYDEFEFNRIYEDDNLTGDSKDNDDVNKDNSNDNNTDNNDNNADKDSTLDDILNNEDLVKAANQLEIFVTHKINMPRDYYFAAIKFKNDDEAIALRWKYSQTLPTGNSTENTRSLIHIFLGDEKKIWVQDFAKDSIVELPKDTKTLVENVLKLLGAQKTNDPDIYTLGKGSSDNSDKDENDDQNQDDDNQNNDDQNQNNKDDKKSNKKDDKNNDLL